MPEKIKIFSFSGNEANSPPIRISDEKVTVSCAPKFAQAVGDAGKTEVQCQTGFFVFSTLKIGIVRDYLYPYLSYILHNEKPLSKTSS